MSNALRLSDWMRTQRIIERSSVFFLLLVVRRFTSSKDNIFNTSTNLYISCNTHAADSTPAADLSVCGNVYGMIRCTSHRMCIWMYICIWFICGIPTRITWLTGCGAVRIPSLRRVAIVVASLTGKLRRFPIRRWWPSEKRATCQWRPVEERDWNGSLTMYSRWSQNDYGVCIVRAKVRRLLGRVRLGLVYSIFDEFSLARGLWRFFAYVWVLLGMLYY